VKVIPHSEKGALAAQAMRARSSPAVKIWNSSSALRGSRMRCRVGDWTPCIAAGVVFPSPPSEPDVPVGRASGYPCDRWGAGEMFADLADEAASSCLIRR
jgi:hypothetical protein